MNSNKSFLIIFLIINCLFIQVKFSRAQSEIINSLTLFKLGISKFEAIQQVLSDQYFDNETRGPYTLNKREYVSKIDSTVNRKYKVIKSDREKIENLDIGPAEYSLCFIDNNLKRVEVECFISNNDFSKFKNNLESITDELKTIMSDFRAYEFLSAPSEFFDFYEGETNGKAWEFKNDKIELIISYNLIYKIAENKYLNEREPTHNVEKIAVEINYYNRYWYL